MSTVYVSVGKDDISEFDCEKLQKYEYTHFVYWYQQGSYEGSGLGAGLYADGKIDLWDLGHCSCFGPTENDAYETVDRQTFEFYLTHDNSWPGRGARERSVDDYSYERWAAVVPALVKILDGEEQK